MLVMFLFTEIACDSAKTIKKAIKRYKVFTLEFFRNSERPLDI